MSNSVINYNYPMSQVANSPAIVHAGSNARVWYSNPRSSSDATWEILKVSLRKPLVITNINFSLLNIAQNYEVWVITSNGLRSQLLDIDSNVVSGRISQTSTAQSQQSWVGVYKSLNPILITQLELRIKRILNPLNPVGLFSLGVRDILLQRTIYTQEDTLYALENQVDQFGNYVRKQVRDWRPELAVDSDSYTFWKSGPQPDPNAVVCYYTSLGNDDTIASRVDRFWLDPVYTGSNLNVYYSNDPTTGIVRPRSTLANTTLGTTFDSSGLNLLTSGQTFSIDTSKLVGWQGLASTSLFGNLGWIGGSFETTGSISGTVNVFSSPQVRLQYSTSTKKFTASIGPSFVDTVTSTGTINLFEGSQVQFIIEVSKSITPNKNNLRLIIGISENVISDTKNTNAANGLASLYQIGSSISFAGALGHFRTFLIKVANESEQIYSSFINDPESFITPSINEVLQAQVPSYTLDNAIYVGAFINGSAGYGGVGDEYYSEKVWTPIWKDWTLQRGFYYLPQPISARYLKFEFSALTVQPYPVYESGISVPYLTFPSHATISSNAQSTSSRGITATSASGALQRESFATNIARAIAPKVSVFVSTQNVSGIRNQNLYTSDIIGSEKISSNSLRAATSNDSRDLASGVIRNYISPASPVNSQLYSTTNTVAVNKATNNAVPATLTNSTTSSSLGSRVPGWWILPGGQLKIPEQVMNHLTASSTTTEKISNSSSTSTIRARFPTVSVHRYDTKYATRDASIAYFAGLRGLEVFSVDYTIPVDSDQYTILSYKEHTDTSTGMTLGDASQTTATYPTTGLTINPASPPNVSTATWNSIGTYVKVQMSTIDRGLHSDTKGSQVGPIGIDTSNSSYWSSDFVEWSDTVVVWGSSTALVGLDFETNIFYSGKQATQIKRNSGIGAAGVLTRIFGLVAKSRVRLRANLFRLADTGNTISIQLVDNTAITGSVLAEYPVNILPGRWEEYKSPYFTIPSEYDNLTVNLLINGTQAETLYVSDLYDEETSILYSLSNDNGLTWYEVTEIISLPDTYFVFPKPGNKLKVKVQMYDPQDYAFGFTITPQYLF